MNGINDLVKETSQRSLTPPTTWGYVRSLQSGRGSSGNHAGNLILNFQPAELWEIDFSCLEAAHTVVFCYSNPSGPKQVGFLLYRVKDWWLPSITHLPWEVRLISELMSLGPNEKKCEPLVKKWVRISGWPQSIKASMGSWAWSSVQLCGSYTCAAGPAGEGASTCSFISLIHSLVSICLASTML